MKKLALIGLMSLALPFLIAPPSFAAVDILEKSCQNTTGQGVCTKADTKGGRKGASAVIKRVINGVLYLIGAIAVIMIVYGGFRYTTSAGDAAAVQNAKGVILYAAIGLAVSLLGFAIVNFVIGAIWK